jgi:phage shock protein PspC (stress-responsive transcriptional regulator)
MKHAKKLYRSRTNRMIAGICGGIGEYFSVDATLVRIGFVIVSLLPGPSIIFYLLAWMIIPLEPVRKR